MVEWVAAGLRPDDFWHATPGLFAICMRGKAIASERSDIQTRASAFMTAALIRAQKLPDVKEWVSGKKDKETELRRWVDAWDKIDAALTANQSRRR